MVSEQFYCFIFLVGPKAFNFLFIFFFLIQSVRLSVVSFHSLYSTCATYCMLCCSSGDHILPNCLPRGAEDISRGVKYPKHMSLPTYLAYLLPEEYY